MVSLICKTKGIMTSPSIGRFKQAQRTDNLWLLHLQLFVDLAEAIVGAQVDDQCCQLIDAHAAPQLAVEGVPGWFLKTVFVHFLQIVFSRPDPQADAVL